MTRKERVKKAIAHEQTDTVPYQIGFTIPAREKMQKYYNDPGFAAKIGNHIAGITARMEGEEIKPGFRKDEWGVIWDKTIDKDIGTVCNCVIEKPEDLDKCKFPDPHDPQRFTHWDKAIKRNRVVSTSTGSTSLLSPEWKSRDEVEPSEVFIPASIGFSLFERAWTMRGMENLLIDMVSNEGFVDAFLDRITEFNLGVIGEGVKFPVDGFMFGDDWGQQSGLIMGPKLWRRFLKPRLAKMYAKVHEAGLPVFIHSCGDVDELFPELIEIGLNVFNPFQPEVMDVYEMKKKYGDKLSFYGGVSTQKTLPYGTPDDVRKEAKRLMQEIGAGGGYIIAPAHSIPKDAPAENIAALIETVRNQ